MSEFKECTKCRKLTATGNLCPCHGECIRCVPEHLSIIKKLETTK